MQNYILDSKVHSERCHFKAISKSYRFVSKTKRKLYKNYRPKIEKAKIVKLVFIADAF